MKAITKQNWGHLPSGEEIQLFTLRNSRGVEAEITNYGGRIVKLKTPDRDGNFEDIVLGFDDLKGYLGDNPYFGALVGRYANRISNGEFTLNGKTYKLARNNGPNALHGGLKGFDKVAWIAREISESDTQGLGLTYLSKDGEEGYPGNLNVTVTYTLTEADELRIEYEATTDKDTVLNLTNHSYFDLCGQAAGNILDHRVTINAETFTPVNANLIPTGELKTVVGTPFDFRKPSAIGVRIDEKDEQLEYGQGYDHNFVLNSSGTGPSLAARVSEPRSGRVLEVLTTQPGVQFYTGNHLDGRVRGKGGTVYNPRFAFCLETQHFPDSPNQPNFPSTELKAGQRYQATTIFRFSIE
ncbi:MAG: galactose mutarotase [Acidobacteriaceae bacterium]|nr:galactose mutarotase [Acidobacteriaceae bacterium]